MSETVPKAARKQFSDIGLEKKRLLSKHDKQLWCGVAVSERVNSGRDRLHDVGPIKCRYPCSNIVHREAELVYYSEAN